MAESPHIVVIGVCHALPALLIPVFFSDAMHALLRRLPLMMPHASHDCSCWL